MDIEANSTRLRSSLLRRQLWICAALLLLVTALEGRYFLLSCPSSAAFARPTRPLQTYPSGLSARYVLTDLEGNNSVAHAINAAGQIAGQADVGKGIVHAMLWNHGKRTDLGTLPGHLISLAMSINDAGQIVGFSQGQDTHAFLWSKGKMTDLGTLPSGKTSMAWSLNTQGQVVGIATLVPQDLVGHAVLWSHGTIHDLGTLPGGEGSHAQSINASGLIVGQSYRRGDIQRAFLYRQGKIRDLGTLGGQNSDANGINARGEIVGWADTSMQKKGLHHAFLYKQGKMQDLGTLGGQTSEARAINASGDIIGVSKIARFNINHACLWSRGKPYDLNRLIGAPSGWVLYSADGINDRGQIVGTGTLWSKTHAFLLTPSIRRKP